MGSLGMVALGMGLLLVIVWCLFMMIVMTACTVFVVKQIADLVMDKGEDNA